MVVADDAGIDAGALQPMGLEKLLRAQEIALENKLPFVHLVESAGANLLHYRVEQFVHGGALFRNLARLSAAGLPVITRRARLVDRGRRLHDRACADHVIMVRGRAPRLPRRPAAAEGRDRRDRRPTRSSAAPRCTPASPAWPSTSPTTTPSALAIARELIASLGWQPRADLARRPAPPLPTPTSCSACSPPT